MNKWFRLAINSFIGIIVINLLYSLLFGGRFLVSAFSLASLLGFAINILYFVIIISLIAGTFIAVKDFLFSREQ